MNVFTVTGRLGRDAQTKTPQNGGEPFIVFSIAEDQFFKGSDVTVWYEVISNENKRLKSMLPYLKKGASVVVTGFQHVALEEYNGDKKIRITIYADRIEFNASNKSENGNAEPNSKEGKGDGAPKKEADDIPMKKPAKTATQAAPPETNDDVDDDLPF